MAKATRKKSKSQAKKRSSIIENKLSAAVNERRLEVVICLRAARDAIGDQHGADVDWHKLKQALKEAIARYEKILRTHDRRVDRRGRERRNR